MRSGYGCGGRVLRAGAAARLLHVSSGKARGAIARHIVGRMALLVAGEKVGADEFLFTAVNVASENLLWGI